VLSVPLAPLTRRVLFPLDLLRKAARLLLSVLVRLLLALLALPLFLLPVLVSVLVSVLIAHCHPLG
jgi:hypothetical protein